MTTTDLTFSDEMILAHHHDPLFMQAWADYREETLGCDLLRRAIDRGMQILHDGQRYWPWDIFCPQVREDKQQESLAALETAFPDTCRLHYKRDWGFYLSCLDPDGALATLPHLLELLDRTTDHRRKA